MLHPYSNGDSFRDRGKCSRPGEVLNRPRAGIWFKYNGKIVVQGVLSLRAFKLEIISRTGILSCRLLGCGLNLLPFGNPLLHPLQAQQKTDEHEE